VGSFQDSDAALAARWSLGFEDLALLSGKPLSARIGFAAQLLAYRATGRFPRGGSEISVEAATYIAAQSGAKVADLADYDWTGRSGRRHRAEILKHLGFGLEPTLLSPGATSGQAGALIRVRTSRLRRR